MRGDVLDFLWKIQRLLFGVVIKVANRDDPALSTPGTSSGCWGSSIYPLWSQETSGDKEHNGRPCEGPCSGEARPRERQPTAGQGGEPCTSGYWKCQLEDLISHRDLISYINKDSGHSAEVSSAQRNLVLPGATQESPVAAVHRTTKCGQSPAAATCKRAAWPLNRGPPRIFC